MRPHFAIYLAASVTLLLAAFAIIGGFGQALVTLHGIRVLAPVGDDLARFRAEAAAQCWTGMEGLLLAVLQGAVLFYNRKLKQQSHAT